MSPAACSADSAVSGAATQRAVYRTALIVAAKGGMLREITTGDVLELLEAEAEAHGTAVGATHLFCRALNAVGAFGPGRRQRCGSCAPPGSGRLPS